jgi:5'-nucleotidase
MATEKYISAQQVPINRGISLSYSPICIVNRKVIGTFMQLGLTALILLSVLALTPALAQDASNADPVELQILAFNDFHGQIEPPSGTLTLYYNRTHDPNKVEVGGAEYLSAYIKELEASNPNTIVVSAGDCIGASPLISGVFHDEPTIEALNIMGLDYSAVGNHELDEGLAELERIQNGLCNSADGCQDGDPYAGAGFRYLASNMVNETTGEPVFPPYAISFVQGIPVGFIGVTLEDMPRIVSPSGVKGLKFLDEADSINQYVKELKERGVEAIVVLIHDGGTQDGLLNECVDMQGQIVDIVNRTDDEVDAFVTGHTHYSYNAVLDGCIVTEAGSSGKILTDIDLELDPKTKDVVSSHARNIAVDHSVPKDGAVTDLINKYKNLSDPLANRVVGSITADITRDRSESGEYSLGDVVADSQISSGSGADKAVVAFMNPGGIRTDLMYQKVSGEEKPGEVTYEEAFSVLPFGNVLVTMTLNGTQIDALLEEQFDNPDTGDSKILQVSNGFAYCWNKSAPKGEKVDMASIKINGKPIDPKGLYRISVNSYLADGGDNFVVLKDGTDRVGGGLDLDAFVAYLEEHSPVSPGSVDRISVVS